METGKVTRFEIINHTPCEECEGTGLNQDIDKLGKFCPECKGLGIPGRTVYVHNENLKFEVQLQDEGRTLKVFIDER